jgi:2-polyprenyl-3-methyl-5-hydroxy-6-metoxy-1,4-benzoquinol methylase
MLDVGCGEGLILNFCGREWLVHYSGLDISQSGLDKIKHLLPTDRLICSALEEFSTEQRFDVILFNEVLYYTADPQSHLEKFRNYLNPGGVFLISTSKNSGWFPRNNLSIKSVWRHWFPRNNRIIKSIWRSVSNCKWKKIDEVLIKNIPDRTIWRIALIRP